MARTVSLNKHIFTHTYTSLWFFVISIILLTLYIYIKVLRKVATITWNSTIAGTTQKGGNTIAVTLIYKYTVVFTGPINLKYYRLKSGASNENDLNNYEYANINLGQMGKPNDATESATDTKSFVVSSESALSAGTYRILAEASSVAAGSDEVKAYSDKFNIAPKIDVTIPTTVMTGGKDYEVSWTITNLGTSDIKISLLGADNSVKAVLGEAVNGFCSGVCISLTRSSGKYKVKIPTTDARASGYKIKISTLTAPYNGFEGVSESFKIIPSLSVTKLIKSDSGKYDDHTDHVHGLDKMAIEWTSTNDPTYKEKWDVAFHLCQGTTSVFDCNLLQNALTSQFGTMTYDTSTPGSASVTIPKDSTVLPNNNYLIQIRSNKESAVTALSTSSFQIKGTIIIEKPVVASLSIKGGNYLSVNWKSRNLNADVVFFICLNAASSTSDLSCKNLGKETISKNIASVLIPTDSSLLHAINAYKIGLKSSMSKTRKPTTTIMKILLSHVQILVLIQDMA
jgi:hypothetical protein